MQSRRPIRLCSLLRPARIRSRRGETSSSTVLIIILAVVGGIILLGCAGVIALAVFGYRQGAGGARIAALRTQSQNNLKMIGLALHNYHDRHRQFPPGGIYGEDETDYHSWQTMLLPNMGQQPLYDQIDFDLPWDDPENSGWFSTPIREFQHPGTTDPPFDSAGFAVSHYAGNSQLFLPNGTTGLGDITDGASNTMMAGEVAAGFKPWGDPANLRDPAAGLGIGPDTFSGPAQQGRTCILMADGAVRVVDSGMDPVVMEAIATPAGGESVPEF